MSKLLMIGTPMCGRCKSIAPKIEEYCSSNNVEYEYHDLTKTTKEILGILRSNNVRQAPAFILYKEGSDSPLVIVGDDVFLELNSK